LQEDWDASRTVVGALRHFESLVELTKLTAIGNNAGNSGLGSPRDRLAGSLEQAIERCQDFTDSAYTTHEHRENILMLCDRAKIELTQMLRNSLVRFTLFLKWPEMFFFRTRSVRNLLKAENTRKKLPESNCPSNFAHWNFPE